MNDEVFDALAKEFAGSGTRRSFVKRLGRSTLVAAAIGGPVGASLWSRSGTAATCRSGGQICRKNGDCCSGRCDAADATGRRNCSCLAGTTACGTQCCSASDICVNGRCKSPTPTPTATPPAIICGNSTCATGEGCADGRCFQAFPNCQSGTCANCWAPTVGSSGSFCTPCDGVCSGADCTATTDCADGQFCAQIRCAFDELVAKCVAGCRVG